MSTLDSTRIELLTEELRRTQRVAALARVQRGRWHVCLVPTDLAEGQFAQSLIMDKTEATSWMRERIAKLQVELQKLGVQTDSSQ